MPERFEFPEGATPIGDCSGLIPVWVHHLHDLNQSGSRKYLECTKKIPARNNWRSKNLVSSNELKAIHQAMFGECLGMGRSIQKIYNIYRYQPQLNSYAACRALPRSFNLGRNTLLNLRLWKWLQEYIIA